MRAGIERRARDWAAGFIGAPVGPVAPVLDAQDVPQLNAGLPGCVPQCARYRIDQGFRTVADGHHRGQPLRAEHADGVFGDVRGDPGTGWIGQVVAERDLDAVVRRLGPEHDQAGLRHEAEQVRYDGK